MTYQARVAARYGGWPVRIFMACVTVATLLLACGPADVTPAPTVAPTASPSATTETPVAPALPSAATETPVVSVSPSAITVGVVAAVGPVTTTGAENLEAAVVTRIVDGDTIDVRLGDEVVRVRLILIDTPEVFGGVQCYGREASARTAALIPLGSHVFLQRDVSNTDRFARLLRYVYLVDGRMLNEVLVAEGYAALATFPPDVKYVERIRAAQTAAREAGRGLWSACAEPTATATTPPAAAPTTTATSALTIVSLTSPVSRNRDAVLAAQTSAGAACSIRYTTPAGTVSQAQGLVAKTASASGGISWTWRIGSNTTPGTGTVSVTCAGVTVSASIVIQ